MDTPQPLVALVDCNSFYCSCERLFAPKWVGRPLIVLSNNDGCAVSLSAEAKALGIPMGAPLHTVRSLVQKHKVGVFSSNYTLYGDISARVMDTLRLFSPEVEVYSIDEAFLNLAGCCHPHQALAYARHIKEVVYRHTGIPVSVGLGPTKVLAKLANALAKKSSTGTHSLLEPQEQARDLPLVPTHKVWGIGPRWASKLHTMGIHSAWDLRHAPLPIVQKHLTIVGRRIAMELGGQPCLSLELLEPASKTIIRSRSFGQPVFLHDHLAQALAHHTCSGAIKLRRQGSVCQVLTVFVATNPHKDIPQYRNTYTVTLPEATHASNLLVKAALWGLNRIFKEGIEYKKCGVVLSGLGPATPNPTPLFGPSPNNIRGSQTAALLDAINSRWGAGTIQLAAQGTRTQPWHMKSGRRSPCYTTRWDELLAVP